MMTNQELAMLGTGSIVVALALAGAFRAWLVGRVRSLLSPARPATAYRTAPPEEALRRFTDVVTQDAPGRHKPTGRLPFTRLCPFCDAGAGLKNDVCRETNRLPHVHRRCTLCEAEWVTSLPPGIEEEMR